MKFTLNHVNINVADAAKSKAFYEEALGLHEVRRVEREGFVLVFLSDEAEQFRLELTQQYHHPQAYDLGENEMHIAFIADDMISAREHHAAMDCICYENKDMGIYFIEDPDGYWLEIIPQRS